MYRIIPLEHLDVTKAGLKLAQFIVQATEICKEDGIDEARTGTLQLAPDPFVIWLTVDGEAVFRGSLVPVASEDGGFDIHAYGTWLPAYRQFLPDEKREDVVEEADDWDGDKTDPEVMSN